MFEAVILECAVPNVPDTVVERIIAVESAGEPLAININGEPVTLPFEELTLEGQVVRVMAEVDAGNSVDIGLMQINTRNIETDADSIARMFDPCMNISKGSEIFMRAYEPARAFYGETELAFQSALSAYNTGTFHRGFNNGYVQRYETTKPQSRSKDTVPDPNNAATQLKIDFGGGVLSTD